MNNHNSPQTRFFDSLFNSLPFQIVVICLIIGLTIRSLLRHDGLGVILGVLFLIQQLHFIKRGEPSRTFRRNLLIIWLLSVAVYMFFLTYWNIKL